jgi:uncharacterized membrane protein YoaK (UPF0700 family)
MPIHYFRSLAGQNRTVRANQHIGFVLAFVAGAINAGGFLAVQQYTSHMTGIVSSIADNVALGFYDLVAVGIGALLAFLLGAACCAVMTNFARRRKLSSEYALPLLLEAILLLIFGILGARISLIGFPFVPVTVVLLCFIMGLQNAVITKLSNAEIRTTHITGIVTDIGIEFGKLIYWNRSPQAVRVAANKSRLKVLILLASLFFVGGVVGALGFKQLGYVSTVPLALMLVALACVPAVDDLLRLVGRHRAR